MGEIKGKKNGLREFISSGLQIFFSLQIRERIWRENVRKKIIKITPTFLSFYF